MPQKHTYMKLLEFEYVLSKIGIHKTIIIDLNDNLQSLSGLQFPSRISPKSLK